MVEKVTVETPDISKITSEDLCGIGGVIATCLWLGISDIHVENLICGMRASGGDLVFAPIDVESIFNEIALPSQTAIIPAIGEDLSKTGAATILRIIGSSSAFNLAAFCDGYIRGIQLLANHDAEISQVISDWASPLKPRIRVVLRDTSVYLRSAREPNQDLSMFIPEEREQLERGDVPYFYRYIGDDKLYYLGSHAGREKTCNADSLGWRVGVRQGAYTPQAQRTIDTMTRAGALQIIRSIARPNLYTFGETQLSINAEAMQISHAGKFRIGCRL